MHLIVLYAQFEHTKIDVLLVQTKGRTITFLESNIGIVIFLFLSYFAKAGYVCKENIFPKLIYQNLIVLYAKVDRAALLQFSCAMPEKTVQSCFIIFYMNMFFTKDCVLGIYYDLLHQEKSFEKLFQIEKIIWALKG